MFGGVDSICPHLTQIIHRIIPFMASLLQELTMTQNPSVEECLAKLESDLSVTAKQLPTMDAAKNPALAKFIAATWKGASRSVVKVQAGIKKSRAQ